MFLTANLVTKTLGMAGEKPQSNSAMVELSTTVLSVTEMDCLDCLSAHQQF